MLSLNQKQNLFTIDKDIINIIIITVISFNLATIELKGF